MNKGGYITAQTGPWLKKWGKKITADKSCNVRETYILLLQLS
jgi:hypothetical protein